MNLYRLAWPHKLNWFSAETWDKTQGGLGLVTYSPVEARSPPNRKHSFPISFLCWEKTWSQRAFIPAASTLGGNTQSTSHL